MTNNTAVLADIHYFLTEADSTHAWIKAFVDLRSGEAVITYAQILVGPRAATWRDDEAWVYEKCLFISQAIPTEALTNWASQEDPGVWPIAGANKMKLALRPGQRPQINRQPSLANHDPHHYPWPMLRLSVSLEIPQHAQQPPTDFLVAADGPSFSSAAGAFSAFFNDDFRSTGANSPSLGSMEITFADTRGSLAHRVQVSTSNISVQIPGLSSGLRLELNSSGTRWSDFVPTGDQRFAQIPLPSGLQSDAWLWLKSGGEWVDYRSLGGWPAYQSGDIEYELPEDPEADLSSLISQGEGLRLEFKSQLPEKKDQESKRQTYKTVAAFAMGEGGVILFGVEDRTGRLLGLDQEEEVLKQRFTSMLRHLVRPTPTVTLKYYLLEEKPILLAEVASSDGTIHGLFIESDKPEYYVRRSATTFYAEPSELQQVPRASQSASGNVFGQML